MVRPFFVMRQGDGRAFRPDLYSGVTTVTSCVSLFVMLATVQ
jgi:hypothetical protein